MKKKEKYLVSPNINDKSLITELKGIDENGKQIKSYMPREISDLKWSLMVELSSYYYSDQSRYILNTFKDSDIKKAIEEMSN